MNRRILLTILCALPFTLFSQTYKFNRQVIINYNSNGTRNVDTWLTPIEIQLTTRYFIMRRPANGAGESATADSLEIKSTSKGEDCFTIKTKDDRTISIYRDELITIATKEINGKRVEYSFFNQKDGL